MLKKIAIVGPESSGKSTIAEQLAAFYQTIFVPEYARDYLKKKKNYRQKDLFFMAKGQMAWEEANLKEAKDFLFCDTTLLSFKIWSEQKYEECDGWILKQLLRSHYDLYFLCKPDIPWEPDPLRENPDDRDELFELHKLELEHKNLPYITLFGDRQNRLAIAFEALNKLLEE